MPTPAVPILTLCDQLVTAIGTAWKPGEPSGVERRYDFPAEIRKTPPAWSGRRVIVFPTAYGLVAESRGRNRHRHRISVLTVERYEDAGLPLLDWADERVEFVYSKIVRGLDFVPAETEVATVTSPTVGDCLRFGTREVWTEEIDEVEVYDADALVNQKLFISQVDFAFGEII